jgi:hypothetical protein
MIPRWGSLLCLATALWPLPASAQPLFRNERNWTVTMGERLYGLRQVVQTPGERRWTQVWMGRSTFDVRCQAEEILALLLLPPAQSLPRVGYWVDWRSFRTLP